MATRTKTTFNYKLDCFYCGCFVDKDKVKTYRNDSMLKWNSVMTLSGREQIMKRCNDRFITMCAKVISNVTDESLTSTASLLFSAHLRNMQEDPKIQKSRIVTKYLERFDDETITLKDLHKLMVDEWGDNETACSEKTNENCTRKSLW